MRFTSYLTKASDLQNKKVDNFILSTSEFGRFSSITTESCFELLKMGREERPDAKYFFEWDCLQTQDVFENKVTALSEIGLNLFDGVRVAELGAFNWVLENTTLPIHLILENGHHNLKGIQTWEKHAGKRLERIVLSLELPKEVLKKYTSSLKTPVELQVLGDLLLFYSPRSLVKNQLSFDKDVHDKKWYEAKANSEESPHRGFTLIENKHGSFMLNPKKQSLLQVLDEVLESGVKFLRVDQRLLSVDLNKLTFSQENLQNLLPNERFIRGYFNVNKTDKIFVKLKNHRLQRRDENFVGTVVDVKKDQYVAIKIENQQMNLTLNKRIEFATPDGKMKSMLLRSMKNISLEDIDSIRDEKIILVPHTSGVSVKTRVNLAEAHI